MYLNKASVISATSSTAPVPTETDAIPTEIEASVANVVDTSMLYESEPMYLLDQARFLNGVCKVSPFSIIYSPAFYRGFVQVETTLSPVSLLALLKSIEQAIGRRKTIDNGPREIDLDILLYDDITLRDDSVDLTVPHASIAERNFVLQPLVEYAAPMNAVSSADDVLQSCSTPRPSCTQAFNSRSSTAARAGCESTTASHSAQIVNERRTEYTVAIVAFENPHYVDH